MANESPSVLLIGSSYLELTANMGHIPAPGETLTDDGGVAILPAGAARLAVAMAKFGTTVDLLSKVGADFHGNQLYECARTYGVGTDALRVDRDEPTGLILRLRERGEAPRTALYPGANRALLTDHIRSAFPPRNDAVLLDADAPFQSLLMAARLAEQHGLPVLVTVGESVSPDFRPEQLPEAALVRVTEGAGCRLTGIDHPGVNDYARIAFTLFQKFRTGAVVITLGSRGAYFYDGGCAEQIATYLPTDRSSAGVFGAEEVYTAALVDAFLRSRDARKSAKIASAALSLFLTKPGGIGAFPSFEEVGNFVRAQQNH